MPKSVPRLVLDKVRLMFVSVVLRVRGKSGEREHNNFDFACVGERERYNLMRSGL